MAEQQRLTDDDVDIVFREIDALRADLAAATERAERYKTALLEIKSTQGKVCEIYGVCFHVACASSSASWAIADLALRPEHGGGVTVAERMKAGSDG